MSPPEPNYFELLGIEAWVSDAQVRKAMLERAARLQEERAAALRAGRETASYDRRIGEVLLAYRVLRRAPDRLRLRQRMERGLASQAGAAAEGAAELLVSGLMALHEGQAREGRELLWRAAQVEFKSLPVLLAAGQAHLRAAHSDEDARQRAEILLKTAVAADPTDPDALFLLGSLYARVRHYTTAEELIREALRIDPHHSDAQHRLRWLERRAGAEVQATPGAAPSGLGGMLQRWGLRTPKERRTGSGDRRSPPRSKSKRYPERRRTVRRLSDLNLPAGSDDGKSGN